jgi:hypothetical protein
VKYDILFITLRYTGHPWFVLKIGPLHLFQSCGINLKRLFEPFILANQRRDTAPLTLLI